MGARKYGILIIFEYWVWSATRGRSNWTREDKFHISKRPCIILFINTNVQFKSYLESFRLVFPIKKLVLFVENDRPTNRRRDTNY